MGCIWDWCCNLCYHCSSERPGPLHNTPPTNTENRSLVYADDPTAIHHMSYGSEEAPSRPTTDSQQSSFHDGPAPGTPNGRTISFWSSRTIEQRFHNHSPRRVNSRSSLPINTPTTDNTNIPRYEETLVELMTTLRLKIAEFVNIWSPRLWNSEEDKCHARALISGHVVNHVKNPESDPRACKWSWQRSHTLYLLANVVLQINQSPRIWIQHF